MLLLVDLTFLLAALLPTAVSRALLALMTVAATLVIGALSGGWAAWRLSRVDPGTTLREGT